MLMDHYQFEIIYYWIILITDAESKKEIRVSIFCHDNIWDLLQLSNKNVKLIKSPKGLAL